MPKNILFLTTANLATNPRLLKELNLALSLGYSVKLTMFRLGNWSDAKTMQIVENLKLSFPQFDPGHDVKILSASKKNKLKWLFWGIMEKVSRKLFPYFDNSKLINATANSRRSLQLLLTGKNLEQDIDLICAHNLGALYPAYFLSKKWKSPFTFDVEDYHPGENISFDAKYEKRRREFLMIKFLPEAAEITFASPLIGEYTLDLIGGHKSHQVILNGFPQNEFVKPRRVIPHSSVETETLKLVWFSQKIGAGRGLEQLFEALLKLKVDISKSIQLTLIGEMDDYFKVDVIDYFLSQKQNDLISLEHIPPLEQSDLHKKLSQFDVGLALEFDTTDLNRQLCLTNKILAYAQAGLFILATDTKAQKQFLRKCPQLGVICGQSIHEMAFTIDRLFVQQTDIKKEINVRHKKSKSFSWENESEKLKNIYKEIDGENWNRNIQI